jgi:MFS transporter, Spinster family, sphingosine-1-phosphate transporter
VTWVTGHVTTYEALLWTRSLMGISEAFYFPAALALIADHHFGATRSRAVGMHQMAVYAGVILGGFSGYIADGPDLGWRTAFTVCGMVGALYAFPLLFLLREPVRSASAEASRKGSFWGALPGLLTNGSFLLLVLYFTLPALAGWIVRDWMPAILKQEFKIKQGPAGVAATSSWQIAAIFGALIGGWISDRWLQTNLRGRIYVSAIGMAIVVPAVFGMGNAGTLVTSIAFLALFGLGWGFFDCNNMPILCQIVRPELRATGYGIMNLVSISCGGLADWGFGRLRDEKVPLNVTFSAIASVAIVAVVLVLLIRPRPEMEGAEGRR